MRFSLFVILIVVVISCGKDKEDIAYFDMDTTYTNVSIQGNIHDPDNLRKVREITESDRSTKGYYQSMKLFDDMDLLFRTYSKNESTKSDGLQIYQNEILIGDVPVPESFEVVGYNSPYFYGQISGNGDADLLQLYRFKIPVGL